MKNLVSKQGLFASALLVLLACGAEEGAFQHRTPEGEASPEAGGPCLSVAGGAGSAFCVRTSNAQFASYGGAPGAFVPLGKASFTVTMLNTGTTLWGQGYVLAPRADSAAFGVGPLAVPAGQHPFPDGGTATFTVQVTGPRRPGHYSLQFQMQGPQGSFGQVTPPIEVDVLAAPYDASFQSISVSPARVRPGQPISIVAVFTNYGSQTWSAGSDFLRMNNPLWGDVLVPLAPGETVPPFSTKVFSFILYAPQATEVYAMAFTMFDQSIGYFGDNSSPVFVQVAP